jgi:hypothetical protein
MWHLMALLVPGVAAIPFDLGKTVPVAGPDDIVVTGRRDESRYRLDPGLPKAATIDPLSVDLGFGKVGPDIEQGRLGDTRVVIRLKLPF